MVIYHIRNILGVYTNIAASAALGCGLVLLPKGAPSSASRAHLMAVTRKPAVNRVDVLNLT